MSNTKKFLDYDGLIQLIKNIKLPNYPNNDTLIAIINVINKELEELNAKIIQPDWEQTDIEALDYIKNKPDEEDALAVLMETGFITPVANTDGSVFTDGNGALYSL